MHRPVSPFNFASFPLSAQNLWLTHYVGPAIRIKTFDPCEPLKEGNEQNPETNHILAVFGALVYELNRYAFSPTNDHVSRCHQQLQICHAYAKHDDDFPTSFKTFPTKVMEDSKTKLQKQLKEKTEAPTSYQAIEKTVKDINSTDKLLAVVATLVTAAKEPANALRSPPNLYWAALGDSKWESLADGTFF